MAASIYKLQKNNWSKGITPEVFVKPEWKQRLLAGIWHNYSDINRIAEQRVLCQVNPGFIFTASQPSVLFKEG